ncbi:MAG: protein kinase [Candidatus Aminicenantes bacterium]|nr:protein kinase [Candidatus Aminicenantes bacterium]
MAEGLGEAHKLGIVHRDLKPGNVMIDKEGNAKIMDFGIARSLAGGGTTIEGAIIGTPEYMSPEQVEGKPADERADIYALGVILFEMVTGRPPFEGETAFAIANKHKSEPAPDPRTLNPQMPVDLSRLILRCLEKEKEKRYQTTTEFLVDLEAVEATLPTAERVPGRTPSRTKPKTSREITVKFNPRKLVVPALVVVAIIVTILIWPGGDKPEESVPSPPPINSIAILPFTDLSPKKDQAALCEGFAETILTALTKAGGLQVRGKHSSFLFSDKDDPREIRRKLNVEKIFMASLQMPGNQIRINVRLVDAADGSVLWSDKFDGMTDDPFDVQDRITSTIVSKMNVALTADESVKLAKRYTNNKVAYDLYNKAK